MTNTPEVDAMILPVPGRDVVTGQPIDVVHADDARVLERQRDNARRQIATLHPNRRNEEIAQWLRNSSAKLGARDMEGAWMQMIDLCRELERELAECQAWRTGPNGVNPDGMTQADDDRFNSAWGPNGQATSSQDDALQAARYRWLQYFDNFRRANDLLNENDIHTLDAAVVRGGGPQPSAASPTRN